MMKVMKRKMPPVPMAQTTAPREFAGNMPYRKTVMVRSVKITTSDAPIETVVTLSRAPWEVQA